MTEQSSGGSLLPKNAVQRSAPSTETEAAAAAAVAAAKAAPVVTKPAPANKSANKPATTTDTTTTTTSAAKNGQKVGGNTATQAQTPSTTTTVTSQSQSQPQQPPAKRPRGRPPGVSRARKPSQSTNSAPNHDRQNQKHQQQQQQQPQQYEYRQYQPQPYQYQYQPPPPPPQPQPHFQPFYNPISEANRRDEFYGILRELDPHRVTPKEFVHLLVHAAVRDPEVAQGLIHLNYERINSPETWRPPVPPNFAATQPPPHPPSQLSQHSQRSQPGQSSQSRPITFIPATQGPNTQIGAPVQQNASSLPSPHQQKRRWDEAAEEDNTPAPTSQFGVLRPSRVIWRGPRGSQKSPPPANQQEQSKDPSFAPQTQPQTVAIVPAPPPPVSSGPQTITSPEATSPPVAPADDSSADSNAIKPIDGEPKEPPCNYTWALDRAETHLGFTGNYDKTSEIRQTSIGYEIAPRLQNMLKKLSAAMDKHVTLANRVHILTVMREIIAATLEADHTVGKECRECSREFDSTYLAAVRKLTPEQLSRLKALEDGKWVEEMQSLVNEANKQTMFPLLARALDHINSAV